MSDDANFAQVPREAKLSDLHTKKDEILNFRQGILDDFDVMRGELLTKLKELEGDDSSAAQKRRDQIQNDIDLLVWGDNEISGIPEFTTRLTIDIDVFDTQIAQLTADDSGSSDGSDASGQEGASDVTPPSDTARGSGTMGASSD